MISEDFKRIPIGDFEGFRRISKDFEGFQRISKDFGADFGVSVQLEVR